MNNATLEAVNNGILTNSQLEEALEHYSKLEQMLKIHGSVYELTWRDVRDKLNMLEHFKRARANN